MPDSLLTKWHFEFVKHHKVIEQEAEFYRVPVLSMIGNEANIRAVAAGITLGKLWFTQSVRPAQVDKS